MKPIFITATGTGVGKTHAACLLIDALFALGVKAAPFKPIETGVAPSELPSDAAKLYETARSHGLAIRLEAICPVRFELPAAPDVARGGRAIDWNAIDRGFDECARSADIVVIEGAGGAFAPIEDDFFSVDLAARFNAQILVIAGDQLGTIHNLLTTIEAIKDRINIDLFWAISIKESLDFERVTEPYLSKKFGSFWRIPKDIDTIAKILCQ
ncbi:ATP-dependent dethiobiotin synthetase BioD [Campylobacterota bacterium]|nr:ATP-dependent dethiobiotin synthetase BioD [Campylobacterota bacterium]